MNKTIFLLLLAMLLISWYTQKNIKVGKCFKFGNNKEIFVITNIYKNGWFDVKDVCTNKGGYILSPFLQNFKETNCYQACGK